MGGDLQDKDQATADSILRWWQEAGVDVAVSEEPRGWLRDPAGAPAAQPLAEAPVEKPADLPAFHQWLATASNLPMDRPGANRVAPRGSEGAEVMLMLDMPEASEAAAGVPIGGDAWSLAKKMLAAIGLAQNDAYIASLSCFQAPGARIGRDELEACAAIARDHVRFASPRRIILFGDAPARALLGEPLARARGRVHRIEGIPAVATFHPRWLMQRPSDKALAWADLLLLMSESI